MALRRRKKKLANGEPITTPVNCGICKEAKTFYTVHGGTATGKHGGKTCCNNCFKELQKESEARKGKNNELSEAESRIERWLSQF